MRQCTDDLTDAEQKQIRKWLDSVAPKESPCLSYASLFSFVEKLFPSDGEDMRQKRMAGVCFAFDYQDILIQGKKDELAHFLKEGYQQGYDSLARLLGMGQRWLARDNLSVSSLSSLTSDDIIKRCVHQGDRQIPFRWNGDSFSVYMDVLCHHFHPQMVEYLKKLYGANNVDRPVDSDADDIVETAILFALCRFDPKFEYKENGKTGSHAFVTACLKHEKDRWRRQLSKEGKLLSPWEYKRYKELENFYPWYRAQGGDEAEASVRAAFEKDGAVPRMHDSTWKQIWALHNNRQIPQPASSVEKSSVLDGWRKKISIISWIDELRNGETVTLSSGETVTLSAPQKKLIEICQSLDTSPHMTNAEILNRIACDMNENTDTVNKICNELLDSVKKLEHKKQAEKWSHVYGDDSSLEDITEKEKKQLNDRKVQIDKALSQLYQKKKQEGWKDEDILSALRSDKDKNKDTRKESVILDLFKPGQNSRNLTFIDVCRLSCVFHIPLEQLLGTEDLFACRTLHDKLCRRRGEFSEHAISDYDEDYRHIMREADTSQNRIIFQAVLSWLQNRQDTSSLDAALPSAEQAMTQKENGAFLTAVERLMNRWISCEKETADPVSIENAYLFGFASHMASKVVRENLQLNEELVRKESNAYNNKRKSEGRGGYSTAAEIAGAERFRVLTGRNPYEYYRWTDEGWEQTGGKTLRTSAVYQILLSAEKAVIEKICPLIDTPVDLGYVLKQYQHETADAMKRWGGDADRYPPDHLFSVAAMKTEWDENLEKLYRQNPSSVGILLRMLLLGMGGLSRGVHFHLICFLRKIIEEALGKRKQVLVSGVRFRR